MVQREGSAARSWTSILGAALAFFVVASLFSGVAFGQGADPPETVTQEEGQGTWHDDVLRIKVAPDVADQATPVKQNGVAMLGVASIDELNLQYNATSIEPLFDVGGEYEQRHREYGLHRWYEIRLEDGMAATDSDVQSVAQAYGSIADVSVAEGKARAQLVLQLQLAAIERRAPRSPPVMAFSGLILMTASPQGPADHSSRGRGLFPKQSLQ